MSILLATFNMNRTCVVGTLHVTQDVDSGLLRLMKTITRPEKPPFPQWEVALKVIFYLFAFLLDIGGNIIVILIIYINKRMRSTTNLLILNLAVSDILVGIVCMWVHLGNQITREWPFGSFVCKSATFIQVLAVTSSILTLTVISIERFFAIVFPLKGKIGPRAITVCIIASWLTSAGIASPHVFIRREIVYNWKNTQDKFCSEIWPKYYLDTSCKTHEPGKIIYYTISALVMYCVPVLVMIVAYSAIAIKLLLRKTPGNRHVTTQTNQDKNRRKIIKMLVAMLVVFIICWTPQQFFLLWDVYRTRRFKNTDLIKSVKYAAVYIAYFNSAVNPVLYAGFNENFRKGFKDAFRCSLWRKRNQVSSVTNARSTVQTAFDMSRVGESSAGPTGPSQA